MNGNSESREERQRLAKKYSVIKQILSVTETLIMFAVLLVLVITNLSRYFEDLSYSISENDYLALLIFLGLAGILEGLFTFPLDFYSGFILEHKYNLSNQTLYTYFKERAKAFIVGLVLGVPMASGFYFILRNFPGSWWLILGIFIFIFSVILARIAPVIIFPLFYKFKPVEDEFLNGQILKLCSDSGVNVKGIFTFDMSRNTKKANAAFTGLGKSKRIIIGDTLIKNFPPEEIISVFAHELGHYKKKHILKMMILSTILTFAGLYLAYLLYSGILPRFGFDYVYTISALPLLFLILSLLGIITSPLINIQSRKYEWEADSFAVQTSGKGEVFASALEKIAEQNLADKQPNRIIEFLFHSHPSLKKRIESARKQDLI